MEHLKNTDLVKKLAEKKNRYYETLKPNFEVINTRWQRYVGEFPPTPDKREPGKDDWKSRVNVPKATANTDAVSSTVTNIICSSSPMIQVTKARDLDVNIAEYGEKLSGYVLRGNRFRSRILPPLIRNAEVQGMQALKLQWIDRSRKVSSVPRLEEYEHFWNEVSLVAKKLGVEYPDPSIDMAGFEVWLDGVKAAGNDIPDMPKVTSTTKAAYVGPWFSLPSFFNLYYNPFISDPQEQEVIFERTILPQSYLLALSDPDDPDSPYDRETVLSGLKMNRGQRFTEEEQAYYNILGLETTELDGQIEPYAEILEAYMPTHPEVQFGAIINETTFINKNPENPNPTGDMPYTFVQRKRVSNSAIGQSPYRHNGGLLDELSTLRSARLSVTSLLAEPSFTIKGARAASMQGMQDYIGGKMYPVAEHGEIEQIKITVPEALFKESDYLESIIDMGWGVGGNVRGQQAQVGRIPLGETQARLTQATLPLIELAREIEDAIEITIPWMFSMFYEYGDEAAKFKLLNRMESLDMTKINQILDMDFVFTGATQAGNRGELAQLILMWSKQFTNDLRPDERRAFAKATATLLGIPDIGSIMTEMPLQMPPTDMGMGIDPNMAQGGLQGAPMAATGAIPGQLPGAPPIVQPPQQ